MNDVLVVMIGIIVVVFCLVFGMFVSCVKS